MLDTIAEKTKNYNVFFRADETIKDVNKKVADSTRQIDILSTWNDLLRSGIIALANPDANRQNLQEAGVYFVTATGGEALKHSSRDPINHSGYMEYLDVEANIDSTTRGYVEEALNTYPFTAYRFACFNSGG